MNDLAGLILLLAVAAAMVALAAVLLWWLDPSQQVARALAMKLGGAPDARLIAAGRWQGVAIRFDAATIAVVRGRGDDGLIYDLDELVGIELLFDHAVAARMFRGEGRKALDQTAPAVTRVALRLVFDDVRDPDMEILLHTPEDETHRQGRSAADAVGEARQWLTRIEAVLRRPVR